MSFAQAVADADGGGAGGRCQPEAGIVVVFACSGFEAGTRFMAAARHADMEGIR
jgi:hypothetical protein